MEDISTLAIVSVLIFFLVIVLLFLHRANKKFADKISVLEQAIEIQDETIVYLKDTHDSSKEALNNYVSQKQKIEENNKTILNLKDEVNTLIKDLDDKDNKIKHLNAIYEESKENIFTLKKNVEIKEKEHKQTQQEMLNRIKGQDEVIREAEEKHTKLTQILSEKKAHIGRLEESVKKQEENILEAEKKHEEAAEENNKSLEEKDKHILVLKEQIAYKDEELIALQKAHESNIEKLDTLVEEKAKEIKKLYLTNKDYENKEKEYSKSVLILKKSLLEKNEEIQSLHHLQKKQSEEASFLLRKITKENDENILTLKKEYDAAVKKNRLDIEVTGETLLDKEEVIKKLKLEVEEKQAGIDELKSVKDNDLLEMTKNINELKEQLAIRQRSIQAKHLADVLVKIK